MPLQPIPHTNRPLHPVRYYHLVALCLCVAIGGVFRFSRITRESLWLDEYFSVYFATARDQPGHLIFNAPQGVLINEAPATDFNAAPSWWKIWRGLDATNHPPIYFIVLRWWIDLFGDGDFATRALSALIDLAAAVVLFEILRRTQGPWRGVIAAGMLCFSSLHLDMSQYTRSYTMLALLGLLDCLAIVNIEEKGVTTWRLIGLGAVVTATALTHYFAAGALMGLGLYVLIRFHGRDCWKIVATFAASMLVVAATWGYFFWRTRITLVQYDVLNALPGQGIGVTLLMLITVPVRMVLNSDLGRSPAVSAVAILVYLLPVFNLRRTRDGLLWWLWMMGTILFVTVLDVARHTLILAVARYTFMASPAMFALLASPLPIRGIYRWFIPATALFCIFCFGQNRAMTGPPATLRFREMARNLDQLSEPGDVIVFTPAHQFVPEAPYMAIRHYMPTFNHPVVFLMYGPPEPQALRSLAGKGHFWMVGTDVADMPTYFPQWHADLCRPCPHVMLWRVVTDAGASTSTEQSPATRP